MGSNEDILRRSYAGLNEGRLNAEVLPRQPQALSQSVAVVPTTSGLYNDNANALALFVFTTSWNDFLLPLVYLRSQETFTVQLMIDSIFRVRFQQNFHLLMSASVLAIIPMTVLFFTLQRQFIAGLTMGSVKE